MLLQELVGVKELKGKTAGTILAMLKKEHGISIAHGAYGVVLMHPSWDHVLKLTTDKAYMMFVEHARANPNPHLPKFTKPPRKLTVFFKNSLGNEITKWIEGEYEKVDEIFAIKIEKLKPIDNKTWILCKYIASMEFFQHYSAVIGTKREDEFLKNPPPNRRQHFDREYQGNRDLTKHKELCQTIFELRENTPHKAFADFNDGNFMMRDDTIVITDPYAALGGDDLALEVEKIFSTKELISLVAKDNNKTVDAYPVLDSKVSTLARQFAN